jgi:hypothetical protein
VKLRLAALLLVCAGAAVWIARTPSDLASARARPAAPAHASVAPPTLLPSAPPLTRDPFRYADEQGAGTPETAARPPIEPEPAPVPPETIAAQPALPRLSGFVRKGGALHAVISLGGELAVVAQGGLAFGYHVVAVDEDAGVTLARDGESLVLKPDQP